MRVRLTNDKLGLLFQSLSDSGYSIKWVAAVLNMNPRTVRDWRNGKFTIPKDHLTILANIANIDVNDLTPEELSDWWNSSDAGKKGGNAYIKKYKSLGTVESKRIGGHLSYKKRRLIDDDIFSRKVIKVPGGSCLLAEFIGIMIGDGNITKYQSSISLNIKTDIEYADYVSGLICELFGIVPTYQRREESGCVVITASSIELTDLLTSLGLPMGDKLRAGLDIPDWIRADSGYSKACLRGIFDTDGSIFQEVHKRKDRIYSYPRMAFVSYSEPLIESIQTILCEIGLSAKIRNNHRVTIERFTDIEEYFRIIGSSNTKHVRRFAAFGGVG
jgi:LAGLIDADG-like domain/WhiA LAGLIDADG-like domain